MDSQIVNPRFLADRLLEQQEIDQVGGGWDWELPGIETNLDFQTFSGPPTLIDVDDSDPRQD